MICYCACGKYAVINIFGNNYCLDCFAKYANQFKEEFKDKNNKIKENKMVEDKQEEKYRCAICDTILDDDKIIRHNDNIYCKNCFENHFTTCDICGEIVDDWDNIDDKIVCSDCQNRHCTCCYHCDEYHLTNNGYYTYDDEWICGDCYNNHYFTCESCNQIYPESYLRESNGEYLCEDCYNESHCSIHEYSYSPNEFVFHHTDNETSDRKDNLHVGIELEIQGDYVEDFSNKVVDTYNEDMFYLKYDGSLDNNGVEIISQPMTYKFISEGKDWNIMFGLMKDNYMSDTDNCGLHFHLDKQYLTNEQIAVIDYIVNNYEEYFSEIGGRNFDECSRYCKKVYKSENDWGKETIHESRYQAVNLTNSDTVELRFCKSTYDFNTFMQRVKMIFAIVGFSKKHNIKDFYNMSLDTFIEKFEKYMKDTFNK